jgi:hypothetical protein
MQSTSRGQQPGQRREYDSVWPGQSRSADGSTVLLHAVDPGGERLVCLSYQDLGERAPLPGPGEGLMPRRMLSLEDWFISTA